MFQESLQKVDFKHQGKRWLLSTVSIDFAIEAYTHSPGPLPYSGLWDKKNRRWNSSLDATMSPRGWVFVVLQDLYQRKIWRCLDPVSIYGGDRVSWLSCDLVRWSQNGLFGGHVTKVSKSRDSVLVKVQIIRLGTEPDQLMVPTLILESLRDDLSRSLVIWKWQKLFSG